jgi:glycosyltransferase involved in cell wall biosynthesis
MMRVAIVTDYPVDPEQPRGGVQAVSVNLVRALASHGDLELHVVTVDARRAEPSRTLFGAVTVHRLPRRGRFTITDATGVGRREMTRYLLALRPDVVHAHDTFGLMVKHLRVPRVFTIHGFIHGDTLVSGGRLPGLRARLWRWIETSGWAEQPHIIAISPYVRERLTGIATGVIHDIENPIGEAFFEIERDEQPGTILSTALVCPRKNTIALIDAFARLRRTGIQAQLRLAGAITDAEYGREVERRVAAHGLRESVRLLAGLSSDAVRRELAAASVFALVSLEENAPLVIEEAMAAGVPVVTSNRCGMPYMVRHGDTGFLVDPHEPADIARRLEQVLVDDGLRKQMAERSRQEAHARFHPQIIGRRTRELYREIVATPVPR